MGLTIADTYYLKAKGAACGIFGGNWEEACEALNYALSYDENHCASLVLLGEIYASELTMSKEAFECFDKVISIDSNYIEVYGFYIRHLIWANEIDRAQKLIEFALSVKGIDKAYIIWLSACAEEINENYKSCITLLKAAKKNCYNDWYFNFIEEELKRIKKKRELEKPKKKQKKSSKKKKTKGKKKTKKN